MHVHVRDDQGKATSNPTKYKEVIEGLRKTAPGLLVEFSTTNFADTIEKQVECLCKNFNIIWKNNLNFLDNNIFYFFKI